MKDGYNQKKELTPVPATSSDDVSYVPEITNMAKKAILQNLIVLKEGKEKVHLVYEILTLKRTDAVTGPLTLSPIAKEKQE